MGYGRQPVKGVLSGQLLVGNQVEQAPSCHATHRARKLAFTLQLPLAFG